MGRVVRILGGNGGLGLWKYKATNYTDLTTVVAPTAVEGDLAYVYNGQGVWLLGTRKLPGVYVYESGVWEYGNQELQDQVKDSQYKGKVSNTDALGEFLGAKLIPTDEIFPSATIDAAQKMEFSVRDNIKPIVTNVDPTVNDDETVVDGLTPSAPKYRLGQEWFNTAKSAIYFAKDLSTGAAVWQQVATSINNVYVSDESHLPAPIGGKIPIGNEKNYISVTPQLVISKQLDLSNVTSIASFTLGNNIIIYTGPDEMFTGAFTGGFLFGGGIVISGTGTNKVWNISGTGISSSNIVVLSELTFVGFDSIGIIDNIGGMNAELQYANCNKGLILKDIPLLSINNSPMNNVVTSNSPRIVLDGTFNSVKLSGSGLTIQNGESYLQLSKNIVITGSVEINGNQFSDDLGGKFYASAKTGAITAFADNGSGGTTVTSAAHGLTIEQVVEITGTTSYNGVHQDIFNVTTNTFDIPVSFVADDATGDFDTGDSNIFRDNNKFDSKSNGDDIDTNEISNYKSLNTITIAPGVIGTPVNINGVALDWQNLIGRRFVTNFSGDPFGTARYTGTKILSMRLSQRITVDPQGGSAKDLSGYITINGVSDINTRYRFNTANAATLNPEGIITLNPNDIIGSSIANDSDLGLLDVLFVNNNSIKA